ncbi:Hypothetical protein D9617_19g102060 [Elsinoe fawcettii]|nr:Hypothetical protein D9617_19g102060 [Elsinoe fawcettii]
MCALLAGLDLVDTTMDDMQRRGERMSQKITGVTTVSEHHAEMLAADSEHNLPEGWRAFYRDSPNAFHQRLKCYAELNDPDICIWSFLGVPPPGDVDVKREAKDKDDMACA